MIAKIFWGFMAMDTAALLVLAYLSSRGPSSPEGPVGGWLLFVPPAVMAMLAVLVLVTGSDRVRMAGIYFLGFPWISVVAGPVYSAFQNYQTSRSLAGDDDFHGVARKLAHAITARDVAAVRSLIPQAGDLNRLHGDQTLLLFALDNAPETPGPDSPVPAASLEIVQALLSAGADADRPSRNRRWPLSAAMYGGPELTGMLLQAGADPNHLDDAGRPLWWEILSYDSDRRLRTLDVLLDHGADLSLRDREGGPVAWAAYHARSMPYGQWRLVWRLIQKGAPWKDEQEFGQPVATMLASDCQERRNLGDSSTGRITDAMRQLQAKFAVE